MLRQFQCPNNWLNLVTVLAQPPATNQYGITGFLEQRVGKKKKEVDISQLWSPEIKADGNWRHSTSAINGRAWDNTWVDQETTKNARTMPVKHLWLNSATGKPDPNKGFFKDIHNVHEFSFNDPHHGSMLKQFNGSM